MNVPLCINENLLTNETCFICDECKLLIICSTLCLSTQKAKENDAQFSFLEVVLLSALNGKYRWGAVLFVKRVKLFVQCFCEVTNVRGIKFLKVTNKK